MSRLRVLIACEFSGVVRDAFARRGHDAWSCDLLPTESPGNHIQGDVTEVLKESWDLVIAHPPCTYLCVSGIHWNRRYPERCAKTDEGESFFRLFIECAPRVAIENPVGVMSTRYRKPDQTIQPWQFGHPECKATCLWLHNLPTLIPPHVVRLPDDPKLKYRMWHLWGQPDAAKIRSRTFDGIAEAMAEQWGQEFQLREVAYDKRLLTDAGMVD